MTDTAPMSPEDRVRIFVGGRMSPDALGPAYQQILDAIDADPATHLDAFERLFLSGRPNRRVITEASLTPLLRRLQARLPRRVEAAARRLDTLMGSLSRRQANEAVEVAESTRPAAAAEIGRQRRQLDRRREDVRRLIGGRG